MKLTRLTASGFCGSNLDIPLHPLTCLVGPPGSGKSTALRSIRAALTGDGPKATKAKPYRVSAEADAGCWILTNNGIATHEVPFVVSGRQRLMLSLSDFSAGGAEQAESLLIGLTESGIDRADVERQVRAAYPAPPPIQGSVAGWLAQIIEETRAGAASATVRAGQIQVMDTGVAADPVRLDALRREGSRLPAADLSQPGDDVLVAQADGTRQDVARLETFVASLEASLAVAREGIAAAKAEVAKLDLILSYRPHNCTECGREYPPPTPEEFAAAQTKRPEVVARWKSIGAVGLRDSARKADSEKELQEARNRLALIDAAVGRLATRGGAKRRAQLEIEIAALEAAALEVDGKRRKADLVAEGDRLRAAHAALLEIRQKLAVGAVESRLADISRYFSLGTITTVKAGRAVSLAMDRRGVAVPWADMSTGERLALYIAAACVMGGGCVLLVDGVESLGQELRPVICETLRLAVEAGDLGQAIIASHWGCPDGWTEVAV